MNYATGLIAGVVLTTLVILFSTVHGCEKGNPGDREGSYACFVESMNFIASGLKP